MIAAALVFAGIVAAGIGVAAVTAVILRALDGMQWDCGLTDQEPKR